MEDFLSDRGDDLKKLRFHYEMTLDLDREVRDHHVLLRCRPMENENQHLLSYHCEVMPEISLFLSRDGFGNSGYTGVIRGPHHFFAVKADGEVQKTEGRCTDFHPMYRFPSVRTMPDESMKTFLRETEEMLGRPLETFEDVCFLMSRLHRRMQYVPGVTTIATTAAEAFADGRGVCQDYAHILIALCRIAGIAARYVAGMIVGEGATHAWCEVWLNGAWTGLDPTNDCLAGDSYIRLSQGRDFADGAVDRGCFVGFASQTQKIYVKVEEVGEVEKETKETS